MKHNIPGLGGRKLPEIATYAYYFANAAHAAVGQVRKYTGEPYINHPVEALTLLLKYGGIFVSDEMMAATLLHDTNEDTGVSNELIRQMFGPVVAGYVRELSKATTPSYGNRAARHAFEVHRLSMASWQAQTIKVADLISNTSSIVERDPEFAKTYLVEKAQLLNAMTMAMRGIHGVAENLLRESAAKLGIEL